MNKNLVKDTNNKNIIFDDTNPLSALIYQNLYNSVANPSQDVKNFDKDI